MLKHIAVPAIFLAVAVGVCGLFATLESGRQDASTYATPQAAIAANFK
jgi:hypothetical protein